MPNLIIYSAISYRRYAAARSKEEEIPPDAGGKGRHRFPGRYGIRTEIHKEARPPDRVKTEARTETYEDAIRFLLEERKKLRPSTFGLLAGAPAFVRDEEEDSYRIRH
jgi:hypothetical protein